MQEDTHVFYGMRRDLHPIKQENKFLWDAHNMRMTSRTGDSLLSLTNEKSTELIMSFTGTDETYIGHCVIGKYLTLFTKSSEGDTIYRIDPQANVKTILYRGMLDLDANYPIQAIADYESELVQKVYWVDGKNPPRVINIAKPELYESPTWPTYSHVYSDAPFNFVLDLNLDETVSVEVLPNSGGIFPAGVIQYAFTYYFKYGQESNIFYTTEPIYLAHQDRGGAPSDTINTALKITVGNPQFEFSYLRIYSIIRTSIDATPTVKRVVDISLKDSRESITSGSVSYIDNGTSGDVVDPSVLLYIGGKDIVAGCIASKDNTLFLGDISYNRRPVSTLNLDKYISISSVRTLKKSVNLRLEGATSYKSQLSKNTSTFKVGETYRLGYQLQYKNGEWSEPIFIGDREMSGVTPSFNNGELLLPAFSCSLRNLPESVQESGYIRARPLVVFPSSNDMTILAQGVLCPTVFNAKNRLENTPFSQSSWIMRPFISEQAFSYRSSNPTSGSIPEFRHYCPLFTGFDRGSEVQNMFLDSKATNDTTDNFVPSLSNTKVALTGGDVDSSYNSLYYVDQSILTFHSPDIEFNDSIKAALVDNEAEVKLVGVVPFDSNYGDIDIETSTPVADPKASGFIPRSINTDGTRSLVSGLFYEDAWIDEQGSTGPYITTGETKPWMVYMWHRSGSLNNDINRPEGKGARTSVLKKKVISNVKSSKDNLWFHKSYIKTLKTSNLQLFDSNEVSLLRISDALNKKGDITYYGNVDSLSASYSNYRLIVGDSTSYKLIGGNQGFTGTITVGSDAGIVEKYFSITIELQTGNPSTGSVHGVVVSNEVVTVPVTETSTDDDGNTTSSTVNKSVSLNGALFDINIDLSGSGYRSYSGSLQIKTGEGSDGTPIYGDVFNIKGSTNYQIRFEPLAREDTSFNFSAGLRSVDPSPNYVGDFQQALKLPKDPVRIKYKSTPHLVFATNYSNGSRKPLPIISGTQEYSTREVKASDIYWLQNTPSGIDQESIPYTQLAEAKKCPDSYLWLAEIHKKSVSNRFGGTSRDALQNNLWFPAGQPVRLDSTGGATLVWAWGDTWYQRYQCIKTYPFTREDENQVVDIGSFMCETRVNIDGRYDRNKFVSSALNISPLNANLINQVYSQKNNFFNYRILDKDYYRVNHYKSQLIWTDVKTPSAIQDSWTNLHMANSLELNGECGKLTSIKEFNNILIGIQDSAIHQILFNARVQIPVTDGVPIEIANGQKVEGYRTYSSTIGCQDKFGVVDTPTGVYFIDNNNSSIYLFNGQLVNVGEQLGSMYWARENHSDMTWKFSTKDTGKNGVRLFYDSKYRDVYFTPGADSDGTTREALCYSEQLGQFTSLMSYGGSVMFPLNSKFYSIANSPSGTLTLWENFSDTESYNKIFGITRPFSFSFISNANPTINKVFDTIEMRADCYNYSKLLGDKLSHTVQDGKPFDYMRADNEYQDTDKVYFNNSSFRKKFRVWRALIPRNKDTRERIRNTWTKVTLGSDNPSTKLSILHDVTVKYTI